MELLVNSEEKELITKYGLTLNDLIEASLIILGGRLIKDREHPISDLDGTFDLTDLNNKTRNIIIGCTTIDNKTRVYRNF